MKKLLWILLVVLMFGGNSVQATEEMEEVTLSTRFPYLYGEAGKSLNYDVEIANETEKEQLIEAMIKDLPDNWSYRMTLDGKDVRHVMLQPEDKVNAKIKLDIPLSADDKIHEFKLAASWDEGIAFINLKAEVKGITYEDNRLSVDYPDLTGDAKTSFNYRLNFDNNSPDEVSYSLDARLPKGWQSSFVPSGTSEKVASIIAEPGASKVVNLKVKAPEFAKEGAYDIDVMATSKTETLLAELSVEITGTYSFKLTTPTGKLSENLVAGEEKQIKLLVQNTGGSDLKNIELSSWEPSGWETRFEDKTIPLLSAGESKEIIAYVKAGNKAVSGDYAMSMTAKTSDASEDIEFRLTVVTSKLWGGVGLGIIAGMTAFLGFVMKRYGRR